MKDTLPLLLSPETLSARLGDPGLLLVDLSKRQIYEQAHVPGAIHVDFKRLQSSPPSAPGVLPDAAQLTSLLAETGLRPDLHVVAYDDEGGGWAGRFLWILETIGYHRYSYLDGGIHAWLAAELESDEQPAIALPAAPYPLGVPDARTQVSIDYLLEHHRDPGLIVWDARSPAEYAGSRPLAAKSGHIPGAVNYEWTRAMDDNRNLRIRDLGVVRAELAQLGITPDKEIVTHCQTHHRSGFTWLLGKILGFPNIRAYPGSWSEWGNHPLTPVQDGIVSVHKENESG